MNPKQSSIPNENHRDKILALEILVLVDNLLDSGTATGGQAEPDYT